VPFVDAKGAPHVLHGLRERGQQVARQTLGQLMDSLQENVAHSDKASFDAMLKQVVADRNNLVHHFHATLGHLSATAEGHGELLEALDGQLETVRALEDLVHGLMIGILRALRDAQEPASDGYADLASMCQQFEQAVGFGTPNV